VSIQAVAWALAQSLPSTKKLVLIVLADIANADGVCWPSQAKVADVCGLTRSCVNKHLGELEKAGLIARERRYREDGSETSCVYRLSMVSTGKTPPVSRIDTPVVQEGYALSPEKHTPLSAKATPRTYQLEPSIEPRSRPVADAAIAHEFESLFWPVCIRKIGKGAARKAYRVARKLASAAELVEGMRRFSAAKADTEPQFIAHPATWLNQQRWLDEEGKSDAGFTPDRPTGPPPVLAVVAGRKMGMAR
jgi:hypothetical protein